MTISGVINALEWDDDDNITAISLSTDDENYIVEPNRLGKELFDCVDEEVEIVGMVSRKGDDELYVKVTGYEILDFFDDDDYDDEYDDDFFDDDDVVDEANDR